LPKRANCSELLKMMQIAMKKLSANYLGIISSRFQNKMDECGIS
jgi:hypothetical protein